MLVGLRSYLPLTLSSLAVPLREPGGTVSARYCYSVWLRHLCQAQRYGLNTSPSVVAELGPGGSIGVGLAALLTGAERYYALDAVPRASDVRNQTVHRDLVQLLAARTDIPDEREFPRLHPSLPAYDFPRGILTDERLVASGRELPASAITYICPWERIDAVRPASVDWVISQAVLEHVDDLDLVYRAMASWLRPWGVMSHEIDFKSHGTAPAWNGHWAYGNRTWTLIRGKRPYLINREPLGTHLRLLAKHGFEVRHVARFTMPSTLERSELAGPFRGISDEDLATSGAYILAVKIPRQ